MICLQTLRFTFLNISIERLFTFFFEIRLGRNIFGRCPQNVWWFGPELLRLSPPFRIKQEVPSKEVLEQEMGWMKEHLSTLGSPVVLCHNDLLCKNIIHNRKEGRR